LIFDKINGGTDAGVGGYDPFIINDCLIKVSQQKRLVVTDIQGKDNQVIEYIGMSNFVVQVTGRLVGTYKVNPKEETKTLKEILADRETVKNNPRSLSARIRKEPLSTDEAFMEDGDKCIFNITNIFEREKQLEDNPIYKRKIKFYRDGETQLVKWRDANKSEEDFCWHVTYIPTEDKANKFYMEGGRKSPGMTRDGAIAVDSYSNSQGGRKYGSKASAWMGRRYDVVDAQNTNKAFGHLYGRPKIKDELHEQVLLAGEYLGYKIWYEFTASL